MTRENIAGFAGQNTLDIKLEAARLMSEALSRPNDAEALIDLAIQMFDYANSISRRRQ
ncbi:MAG: hypothetical protein ACM31L_17325 [Actinomycetota bacterium]